MELVKTDFPRLPILYCVIVTVGVVLSTMNTAQRIAASQQHWAAKVWGFFMNGGIESILIGGVIGGTLVYAVVIEGPLALARLLRPKCRTGAS